MNFVKIGQDLCRYLIHGDYTIIATEFGYSIAFDKPIELAIREDFETALQKCECDLNDVICNVVIKEFSKNEPGLIRLIECRLCSPKSHGCILAEIIQNETGIYLEQISYEK